MFEELNGKGILIHHWDTDGMCSTRLLLKKLSEKDIDNRTPQLGNYFLTEEELAEYSKYDFVIVADMAIPEEHILRLAKNAQVMIFDHHLQPEIKQVLHHNPIIKGENPDKYPSASWIVNDYLGNDVNLFALLGIVGDHEQKIMKNETIYKIITDFCNENDITFDDMLKMVYLLDSNYKLGDKKAVEKAPHLLLTYNSAADILNNAIWNENYTKLNEEIKNQLDQPVDEINGTILKKMNTHYNIISTITRQVAWSSGKNTVVVNTGFFKDMDQVYVRGKKDAAPLIKRGKELGFKCGGKREVLGAIVPKDQTNSYVEEILKFLSK
jgi:single-stranded DNA-specific DHH superfamily exonuclease